jgi:hypothetical protein
MENENSQKMIPEQTENKELDVLIRNVLSSNDDLIIPAGLSEKTIRNLEKKILLRELVLELFMKVGLISGSLAVLAGVFILVNGKNVLNRLYAQFADNWHMIISLLFLVFITIFIDQVGLRFHNTFHKETGLKIR